MSCTSNGRTGHFHSEREPCSFSYELPLYISVRDGTKVFCLGLSETAFFSSKNNCFKMHLFHYTIFSSNKCIIYAIYSQADVNGCCINISLVNLAGHCSTMTDIH